MLLPRRCLPRQGSRLIGLVLITSLWSYSCVKASDASAVGVVTSSTHKSNMTDPTVAKGKPPRRCYWCGPLADQVHKSTRAPTCTDPDATVECDPGYEYCAIVATSPPHEMSKYCVKMYQDECYSSYCNTTKKWKVICPCKGDLCNIDMTEREEEAFKKLTRTVVKTLKMKVDKRSIPGKLIGDHDTTNKIVTNNSSPEDNPSNVLIHKIQSKNIEEHENNYKVEESGIKIEQNAGMEKPDLTKTDKLPEHAKDTIETKETEDITTPREAETSNSKVMNPQTMTQDKSKTVEITQNSIKDEIKEITIVKPTELPQAESLQEGVSSKSNEDNAAVTSTSETEVDVTTENMINVSVTETGPVMRKNSKNFGISLHSRISFLIICCFALVKMSLYTF